MYQIECENLTLSYEGKNVIANLSFGVKSGDYLCIVGENGSGKSTLIKGLLGLKKPSDGKIVFGEHKKIGYLPQNAERHGDFPATVYEVVLSGCLNDKSFLPFYTKEQKKKTVLNLEKLGISDLKNVCYRNLSGGQQQRVLLARALCAAEDMLLLDEPVTGLDPIAEREMYDLTDNLNRNGMTVIMVTHDIISASEKASHILHLCDDGYFFGSVEEYKESELFKKFRGGENNA